jgi:hypothetical protein
VAGSSAPGRGAGGVGLEFEGGVEVLRFDAASAIEERVGEREADDVGFGAGSDLGGEPGLGLGQVAVGVVPEHPDGR